MAAILSRPQCVKENAVMTYNPHGKFIADGSNQTELNWPQFLSTHFKVQHEKYIPVYIYITQQLF